MKIKLNNPFQTVALFLAVSIFSTPLAIYAQQNTVMLDAKADAEKDAERDVNKLAWFTAGLVGGTLIGFAGAIGGCIIGGEIDPPPSGGGLLYTDTISDGEIIGILVGAIVGTAIPLVGIYNYKPNLPPDRFIGKSPEYIDHYTDVYRKKARSIRTGAAASGIILPGCLIGLGLAAGG